MASNNECSFEYRLLFELRNYGPGEAPTVYVAGEEESYFTPKELRWLNGDQLCFSLAHVDISEQPLKTNRPVGGRGYMCSEPLIFDSDESNEDKQSYHPVSPTGWIEVLVNSEVRSCRLSLLRTAGLKALEQVLNPEENASLSEIGHTA